MKVFNQHKIRYIKYVEKFLFIFKIFRLPIWFIAKFFRNIQKNRPDYLIVDGFLVGDCVFLRPLCKSVEKVSGNSYYLGGSHSKHLLEDIELKIIHNQFPWATYNYSFSNIYQQLKVWLKIFFLQPRKVIETRGDLRSILFLYMACPQTLVGYSFTGGKTFLDIEPKDNGKILSLAFHNENLALSLGLEYKAESIKKNNIRAYKKDVPEIGLSFSGSQILKSLPRQIAKYVLEILKDKKIKLSYLYFKKDFFFHSNQDLLKEFSINIIYDNSFQEYLSVIESLDAYIGMDSAGGHICSIYQVPCMIFFGTNFADYAKPIGNPYFIPMESKNNFFCRPCFGNYCEYTNNQGCLLDITKQDLEQEINRLLEYTQKRMLVYK